MNTNLSATLPSATAAGTPDNRAIRRVVVSAVIGATIEWYDFFLYGVVAGIVFNKLYFPPGDPIVATLLAYTTFAVGFVTRPLGGVIFGHFGDRIGRKTMLIMTLMIMGIATFLIGLVPTYEQIGVAAPLLLLLLRVFQGIGLGGEWGGAVLMTYEYAPKGKRGLYASLPQIGLGIGLFLASGVVALLSSLLTDQQFLAWGWRVAFVVSAAMVAVGIYIRMNISETPEFEAVKARNEALRMPFMDLMKRYPGNVLKGMGARYIDGVFFNVFAVFSIGYLASTVKISRTDALIGVMIAALVMIFTIPMFGRMSDRYGRPAVYAWGSAITALASFPAFWMMTHAGGNVLLIWLAIVIPFGILYASIYGPEAALFCDLFDAKVRYTGISFVYQFSGIFASGITPLVATALLKSGGGEPWQICAYVVFAVFAIGYLVSTVKISRTQALMGVMAAALVMIFTIPLFGSLSDRIGRTKVYMWGSLITALTAFPAFWFMTHSGGNTTVIWLAIAIPLGIIYASVYGPEAALFCDLFDAKVRYSGISFVYQFSGIFASGITPIVATALLKSGGGEPWQICMYVVFAGVVSAASAALIGRSKTEH